MVPIPQERGLNATVKLSVTLCLVIATAVLNPAVASPFVSAGDMSLRSDIQRLADYGIIKGPVTTWPLAWGPIANDLQADINAADLPPAVRAALDRVRTRAAWENHTGEYRFRAGVSVAEDATRIRGFHNTPREKGEVSAGIGWTGDWLMVDLNGQVTDSPADGKQYRMDGSSIGIAIGNYSITANTLERWWGPGWDGSLILSNNARPIPSLSIDRNFTDAFESRWLSWLGPWDLAVHYGQFESERVVPNARFFGMRFNFRPLQGLEIGLSRTAQWCGNGRPCGFDVFTDLLLGIDNRGGQGVDISNEPGNQLAGVDFRWVIPWLGATTAVYGQLIGEDEAGGLPSRSLGLLGVDGAGMLGTRWSYHWFGEFAGTSCQFYEDSELFNCAYNHGIYQTGYRFLGRSVGHGADNDAQLFSAGFTLSDDEDSQWHAILRFGGLNRGGFADSRNTLTPTRQDIFSADVSHRRFFPFGQIEIGVGFEQIDDRVSGQDRDDIRGFLQWRSAY